MPSRNKFAEGIIALISGAGQERSDNADRFYAESVEASAERRLLAEGFDLDSLARELSDDLIHLDHDDKTRRADALVTALAAELGPNACAPCMFDVFVLAAVKVAKAEQDRQRAAMEQPDYGVNDWSRDITQNLDLSERFMRLSRRSMESATDLRTNVCNTVTQGPFSLDNERGEMAKSKARREVEQATASAIAEGRASPLPLQ